MSDTTLLRNLSDLGPRVKKRVTYSASRDSLTAVTLDYKRPCVLAVLPPPQPSIVSEEDEELTGGAGQQPQLSSSTVDEVKSCTSDTSSTDINSHQSDHQCLQRHTCSDVIPHV